MFLLLWGYNLYSKNPKIFWRSLIYLTGLFLAITPFINGILIDNIRESPSLGLVEDKGILFPFYAIFSPYRLRLCFICLIHTYRKGDEKPKNRPG